MSKPPFVSRLIIENFRSIPHADLEFGPLTYLVGPNGAGKSNILKALQFVADALRYTIFDSPSAKGNLIHVPARGPQPTAFTIRIEFCINHRDRGSYEISLEGHTHKFERLTWVDPSGDHGSFIAEEGRLIESTHPIPRQVPGLFLSAAAGVPPYDDAYRKLCGMRFYDPHPDSIRSIIASAPSSILARDAHNAVDVVNSLIGTPSLRRVIEYLSVIAPGIVDLAGLERSLPNAPFRALYLEEEIADTRRRLPAFDHSDGTLRALGCLLALFQRNDELTPTTLVAIEEPEAKIHPGAADVLREALHEASESRQVIVTSHGAEILDHAEIDPLCIIAVAMIEGKTVASNLDPATTSILRDRLLTAGELLRDNNLRPVLDNTVSIG